MINQSTGLINTLQYKLAGLCYLKSFNPRHLVCVTIRYHQLSVPIVEYVLLLKRKNISWFIVENKEDLLIYLRLK